MISQCSDTVRQQWLRLRTLFSVFLFPNCVIDRTEGGSIIRVNTVLVSCTFQMRISPSDLCQWTSETLGDSLKVSSSSQKGTWSPFPGDSILIFSLFLLLRSMMLLLSLEIVIVPSFCLPTQWLNLDIFLESSNLIESYITGKFIGNSVMFPFSSPSN